MIVTARPLHNQSIPDDDTFVTHFVARRMMLEALLRRLRTADGEAADLHRILIGPRGMGKTSLLRRIAIAINRTPDLAARYVPLTFREEQYNVLRIGDFWRNCGEALAEWAEMNGHAALARRLDVDLASRVWADDAAGERFAEEMRGLERRAVLLVDNLDLILDALERPDGRDNWTLRRYLQHPGGPIMIGAATKPLSHSVGREAAFYEFFQPDYLNSLDAVETEACMRALAAANGSAGERVIATLDLQPERLKTLHTLTGGNPRVLALIYRLLETDETGAAMDDLALLLDQVTPYYKARIEEYTPPQRAILDGIALHWDPITIAQLSQATDIPTTTLSGQLTRMIRKDNIVEAVETSGAYSGYQLVERFFNIWYLMRHGTRRTKQKMRWLVEFLTSFYSAAELNDIARRAQMKGTDRHWSPEYSEAINQALSRRATETQITKQEVAGLEGQAAKPDAIVLDLLRRASAANEAGDDVSALSLYDQIFEHVGHDAAQPGLTPPLLFNRALILRRMGRLEEAIANYDRLIKLIEPADQNLQKKLLVQTLLNKSVIIGLLHGPAQERELLDTLIARFDADPEQEITIAWALLNRVLLSTNMNDITAAYADYDIIVTRFGGSNDPRIVGRVTRALFNKAMLLMEEERWLDAIEAFKVVESRVSADPSESSIDLIAGPSFNQAVALTELGEYTAALARFDTAISLFEESSEYESRRYLSAALYNKASMLRRQDDIPAAERGYTRLVDLFEDTDNPAVQPIVAHALMDLAQLAALKGDYRTEMAYYDTLLNRFTDKDTPDLQSHVAQAMVNRAWVLDRQADKEPVIAIYDEIIARFSDAEDPVQREAASSAMVNRAVALGETQRFHEALAAFDTLVERFGKDPEPRLRGDAARGLYNKAITYHLLDDVASEQATYRAVLDLLASDSASELDEAIIDAALNLGFDLEESEPSEAIDLYNSVLARFAERPAAPSTNLIAIQVRLSNLLADTAIDIEQAEAILREIQVHDPVIGLSNRAWLALLRGDGEAAAALVTMLDAFSENEFPKVGRALLNAAIELSRSNFGLASEQIGIALEVSTTEERFVFDIDYIRLLRVAVDRGFGDRMLDWFSETGFAERFAPLYVAFRALVRGEATLRDASPEVAEPAEVIFARLIRRRGMSSSGLAPAARRTHAGRRVTRIS